MEIELCKIPDFYDLAEKHGQFRIDSCFQSGDLDGIGSAGQVAELVLKAERPKTIQYLTKIKEEASVYGPQFEGGVKWETNRNSGTKINYGRFLEGKERFMSKLKFVKDNKLMSGVRIVTSLSAAYYETQASVNNRCAASLAMAGYLQDKDVPTEIVFTWASKKRGSMFGYDAQAEKRVVFYLPIKDPTYQQISVLSSAGFLRSVIFSIQDEQNAARDDNDQWNSGRGAVIQQYSDFKLTLLNAGVLDDGDILVDWSHPVEKQIQIGLEQVDLNLEAERDEEYV